tara:strand:+ start:385 stop:573 length:189 start_codon:yes stop_codon:yes gene_type:complete
MRQGGNAWLIRTDLGTFRISEATDDTLIATLEPEKMKVKGLVYDKDDKHLVRDWGVRLIKVC